MKNGVAFSILACTCVGAMAKTPERRVEKPNVLFILVDDMQLGAVRRLGFNTAGSSVINNLINNGTSFTQCYTMGSIGGALSMPSRAMILTGRTLFETPGDGATIPTKNVTLPESLRANGYNTFATGKWHSDYESFNRSFSGGDNIYFGGMHPYNKGGHTVPWLQHYDAAGDYKNQKPFFGEKFSSQMYADAAINFLNTDLAQQSPFFCYVAFTSPHDPHNSIPWYSNPLDSTLTELPANYAPQHAFDNGELTVRDETVIPAPRTPEVVRQQLALYGGMINEVGIQIGRILSAIEKSGLARNTIIVFTSDNGLAMGQHGLMGKQSLYNHSTNVPLVIQTPGQRIARKVNTPCYIADINPTLYDLTGIDKPSSVTCPSLVGTLKGGRGVREAIMLSYSSIQRAVVWNDCKYIIYNVDGVITEQFFDLKSDPFETNNLVADRDRVAKYRAKLMELMAERGDFCNIEGDVWWSDGHKITWNEGINFTPTI